MCLLAQTPTVSANIQHWYLIPSPINHPINLSKFRLQNFASVSPYLDMTRLPSRFSPEILEGFNVGALIGDSIIEFWVFFVA